MAARDATDVIDRYFTQAAAPGRYAYPLSELITEPSEHKQDPGKRDRERAVIAAAIDRPWRTALDFGCGVGANFDLFAECPAGAQDAVLAALDPDPDRAAAARARAPERLRTRVSAGGVDLIDAAPPAMTFDVILACQVLGHVARDRARAIVSSLYKRLSPGGRLAVAVPVAFPAARSLPFARSWDGESDLFHEVRPGLPPTHDRFRTHLAPHAFDEAANAPRTGVLPVRSFLMSQPPGADFTSLPAVLRDLDQPVLDGLPDGVEVDSLVYSVHVYQDGRPAMADVLHVIHA
ncbi:class I SAM-dependent methyltransferase [Maricaulaceae bacterium MS644]